MVEESSQGAVLVARPAEHVVVVTLNRPEQLNPVGGEMTERLIELWPEIDADPTIRVAIVTGAGRAFCSGADMDRKTASGSRPKAEDALERRGIPGYQGPGASAFPRFTSRQSKVYKPTIAAVNGVCAGAGLYFVADADISICSDNATFVDTHVSVGQLTALEPIGLALKMPLGSVLRMVCMGRHERLDAKRAYELGLISEVLPLDDLMPRALEIARLVASNSPATLQRSLRAIWQSFDHGLTEAYYHGFAHVADHWDHPDAVEGPLAFIEKRDANWVP